MSIDPVVTDANTGGSFNRYVYANNSPYKYIDPDGRVARGIDINCTAGCDTFGSPSSGSPGSSMAGTAKGATMGLMAGILLSGACDFLSGGVCAIANPWIIGASTTIVGGMVGANSTGSLGPIFSKPPSDAKDQNGAKAPGKPGEAQGFKDPKGGENWVRNPNPGKGGGSHGWLDNKGNVWVPTGQGGNAHSHIVIHNSERLMRRMKNLFTFKHLRMGL